MRKDEEYAKSLLVDKLRREHKITVENGNEPPDYYFFVDGVRYAVEITWLEQSRTQKDRKISRFGEKTAFFRLVSEVNSYVKQKDLIRGMYTLTYEGQFTHSRRDRDAAKEWIISTINHTKYDISTERLSFQFNTGCCLVLHKINNQESNLVGITGCTGWSPNIQANASHLLKEAINEKQRKLSRIKEPVILVLLNRYWLADPVNYKESLSQLNDIFFQAIYMIHNNKCIALRALN